MIEFFIDFNLVGINEKSALGYKYVNKNGIRTKVGFIRTSDKYKQCKSFLVEEFRKHEKTERPEKPYKITIKPSQYADRDAYTKIIYDALEEAGVIDDDKYVLSPGDSVKTPIKRGGKESHYIRVEHFD